MSEDREELWIALSDLWLDTELTETRLGAIAAVVRRSGLSRAELEDVFALELAPFLGGNSRSPAGEWAGFQPEWVCERARALRGRRRAWHRLLAALGVTTGAARPDFERVLELAFGDGPTP